MLLARRISTRLQRPSSSSEQKSKNLRGISEVRLLGSTSTPPLSFTQWKVQGNRGGEVGFPDRVRGIFNEGGFYGEREGWHLPGFDDSAWNTSMAAPALDGPGVRFFRSKLDLVIPDGHDAGMSFDFGSLGGHHRVYLYVNGWQMGRMAASVGPQVRRPAHDKAFKATRLKSFSLCSSFSRFTRASSFRARTRSRLPFGRTMRPTRLPSTSPSKSTGSSAVASVPFGPTTLVGRPATKELLSL